jgi:hypothetical protein
MSADEQVLQTRPARRPCPPPCNLHRDGVYSGASLKVSVRGRKVLGWPKICKLAYAFLWKNSKKGLQLAQLLGQLGIFLTCAPADEQADAFREMDPGDTGAVRSSHGRHCQFD